MENCSDCAFENDDYFTSSTGIYLDFHQRNMSKVKKKLIGNQYNLKNLKFEARLSLLEAAAKSDLDIFKTLLTTVSDINCYMCGYYGLLYITISQGYGRLASILKSWFHDIDNDLSCFLIEHCMEDKTDINKTAVFAACFDGHYTEMCTFINDNKNLIPNYTNLNGWNLLHVASMVGDKRIVDFLLSETNYINTEDKKRNTPLHMACIKGDMKIIKSMAVHREFPVNVMLETPLHVVCQYGHCNAVNYFINNMNWKHARLDQYGYTPLHTAAIGGHLDVIEYLCTATDSNVDSLSYAKEAPIHLACKNGHLRLVKYFIEDMLCDVMVTDGKGNSITHLACQYGFNDIVDYLVSFPHNDLYLKNNDGMVPLHIACKYGHINIVKEIAHKTSINLLDNNRESPLHHACRRNSLEIVNFLLHSNCRVNMTNCEGFTAINIAVSLNHILIVKYLMINTTCDINVEKLKLLKPIEIVEVLKQRMDKIWLFLIQALNKRNFILTGIILKNFKCDSFGDTAMHYACTAGSEKLVKLLEQEGHLYIHQKNHKGSTPFQIACQNDDIIIFRYNFLDPVEFDSILIAQPSLLWEACRLGSFTVVKYLIEVKLCNTAVVDDNNWTLLHCAASQSNSFTLLPYLVQNIQLDLLSLSTCGQTPLHVAYTCKKWRNVKYLISMMKIYRQQSDMMRSFFDAVFQTPELSIIKSLSSILRFIYYIDRNGNNLLHVAASYKNLSILDFLFSVLTEDERLFYLLQKNNNGMSPLALACSKGVLCTIHSLFSNIDLSASSFHWSVLDGAFEKKHLDIIIFFCNRYEYDIDGSTALHHACSLGNLEVACYLIAKGYGDLLVKDNAGHTSLDCACIKGHLNILKYFSEYLRNSTFQKTSSPLLLACKNGHVHIVKYLFEKQLSLQSIEDNRMAILKSACMSETCSIIRYFIDSGFLELISDETTSLLHTACENGWLETVKYFLQNFKATESTNDNPTPSKVDSLQYLSQSRKIYQKDNGYTPLHTAARYGQVEVALHLLKTPFLWVQDNDGCTPLHIACNFGNIDFVKNICSEVIVIINNVHAYNNLIESTDNSLSTILHHACCHHNSCDSFEVVKYLLNELKLNPHLKDNNGMTALHHSCASGNLEVVKLLVKSCNTTECDSEGQTPLHHCAACGHLDIIKYLVSLGITDIMSPNTSNNTPLHVAVIFDRLDVVKYFLDGNFGDPNSKGEYGKTLLVIAASYKCTQTFNYLFFRQAKCDFHIADCTGQMIICYAYDWERKDVIDKLVFLSKISFSTNCHKAMSLLYSAAEDNHFESFKYILNSLLGCQQKHPSDVLESYIDSSTGNTALHVASIYGRLDVVKYLTVKLHCKANDCNSDNQTCLHLASVHGKVNVVKFLSEQKLCEPLHTDSSGKTSLHLAAENNQLEVLQYYVEDLKLDPQVRDNTWNTCLHSTCQSGHREITEYLLSFSKSVRYNIDKSTPLHLAVQNGHFSILELLLSSARYNIYERNRQKMSVIDYAQHNTDIARHIRDIYGLEANLIPKIFIVGFPGTGKSTLFKALQKESGLLRKFITVSKVELHTVGVKSTEFQSKKYGTVQLYDFAGDEEYHANHQLLFQNTPLPIVILLLNLTWGEEEIVSNFKYWIRLIANSRSALLNLKKSIKVVIVGSHYDKIHNNKAFLSKIEQRLKLLISQLQIDEISFGKELLFMNCKKVVSNTMEYLQDQLYSICISCRAEIVKLIPFRMSIMCQKVLDFIREKMFEEVAFNLKTLCIKARETQYIPEVLSSETEIIEYCNGLSYFGKILLLKDNDEQLNSWVILNENYLLSKFHESMKILSSESAYNKLMSCGLINLQQLKNEFQDKFEVILEYSKHFQICTEVNQESFSIIPSPLLDESQYYFFPNLIVRSNPDTFNNQPNDQSSLCYGWQLIYNELPSPRFLQVLFVQLTVPVPGTGDVLQPVYTVWKNGIRIKYNDTTECIIEVSDTLTQLLFSIRCQVGNENKLLLRRSRLVDLIHSMLIKNCPSITYREYVFEPQHSFPIDTSLKKVLLNRIAGAIIEGRTTVVSSDASECLDLAHVLCSEPVLNLSLIQLKRMYLNPEDTVSHSVLTKICSTSPNILNFQDEIKCYENLHQDIFSYSIFTDRNIWVSDLFYSIISCIKFNYVLYRK